MDEMMNNIEIQLKLEKELEKELKQQRNKQKSKYDILWEHILLLSNNFLIPSNDNIEKAIDIQTDSWFSILESKSRNENPIFDSNIDVEKDATLIRCEKIRMYPTNLQRKILLIWMDAYISMYNETIKLFKKRKLDKLPTITNWKKMRTFHLKQIKDKIIKQTKSCTKQKTQVNSHILDGAIQDACSKLKSCLTNLKNGNIKHFRLRYLKQSKDTKIIKIEKYFINTDKNTFCSSIFKDGFVLKREVNGKYIDFKLSEITKDFTIHYNAKTNEFTLLNPVGIDQTSNHTNKDTIALDPGLCRFMSGYSTNGCMLIGKELMPKIIWYLKRIDRINNNKDIGSNKKRKVEQRCYKKIERLIDDMHWKVIKYLTTNFGNIVIGNLSTKNIISNSSKTDLNGYVKRTASLMKLYQFKQRLAFKCKQLNIGYKEVDEAYTSKTCTECGCIKTNLGKTRKYKCNFCGLEIDRDFGGARNIFIGSIDI